MLLYSVFRSILEGEADVGFVVNRDAVNQRNKRGLSRTALNAAQKEKKPKTLVNKGITAFANKKVTS